MRHTFVLISASGVPLHSSLFHLQDAAASEATMQEIVRVAKEEIIMCTIHSPSTKVYNGFDKVMILSKGRQAFTGSVAEAPAYFEKIGYPLPPQTNPAGMDLVIQREVLRSTIVCSLLFAELQNISLTW